MPFSRECAEDRRVQPGSSSWWGVLLEPNTDPATLESHPFKRALLCGHTYTLQGANATKVANHVSGEGGGIRACSRATAEDKVLVTDKRRTPVQSSTAMLHEGLTTSCVVMRFWNGGGIESDSGWMIGVGEDRMTAKRGLTRRRSLLLFRSFTCVILRAETARYEGRVKGRPRRRNVT